MRTVSWSPACPVFLTGFVINKAESGRIRRRAEAQRSPVWWQGKRALLSRPQSARENCQGKEKFFMKSPWGVARNGEVKYVCEVCKE